MSKRSVKTADINEALRKRFCAPQWSIFFEVAEGTGSNPGRYADAVAMGLWPSQGLEIWGFEVKVYRSDWLRELKQPRKAEAVAAYCDKWWIAASEDVVQTDEVPPAWGLMTWDGKVWRTAKKAEKTAAKDMDRFFLAALLRRAGEFDAAALQSAVDSKVRALEDSIEQRIKTGVEFKARRAIDLINSVEAFEAAAGIKINSWDAGDLGQAVRVIRSMGANSVYGAAFSLADQHERAARSIRETLEEAGFEPPKQPELPMPRRRA